MQLFSSEIMRQQLKDAGEPMYQRRSAKKAFMALLAGGIIVNAASSGYRVTDKNRNPVVKLRAQTFEKMRILLRQKKAGIWVINKSAVRSLHGNCWEKKYYKAISSKKINSNSHGSQH